MGWHCKWWVSERERERETETEKDREKEGDREIERDTQGQPSSLIPAQIIIVGSSADVGRSPGRSQDRTSKEHPEEALKVKREGKECYTQSSHS